MSSVEGERRLVKGKGERGKEKQHGKKKEKVRGKWEKKEGVGDRYHYNNNKNNKKNL